MARGGRVQYPWSTVSPAVRLKDSRIILRGALDEVRIEGFGDIPKRVRKVVVVSERIVETLEYGVHGGMGRGPRDRRVAAAEIVERVSGVNAAVRALASASALTLSLTALMEPPMSGLMEPLTGADLGSRTG